MLCMLFACRVSRWLWRTTPLAVERLSESCSNPICDGLRLAFVCKFAPHLVHPSGNIAIVMDFFL